MAKNKSKISIGSLVALIASVVAVVMFFLPYVTAEMFTVSTASGWQFFTGMFNPAETADVSVALMGMYYAGVSGLEVQYSLWAYLIAIFATLATVAALLVAVFSVMQLIGLKVNDKLVRLLTYVATACMIVAFIAIIIRVPQANGDSSVLAISYGAIVSLCALIGASVVKFLKI